MLLWKVKHDIVRWTDVHGKLWVFFGLVLDLVSLDLYECGLLTLASYCWLLVCILVQTVFIFRHWRSSRGVWFGIPVFCSSSCSLSQLLCVCPSNVESRLCFAVVEEDSDVQKLVTLGEYSVTFLQEPQIAFRTSYVLLNCVGSSVKSSCELFVINKTK